jgi:hypothetical protein
MQRRNADLRVEQRVATPAILANGIRLLDIDRQYRICIANPGMGGLVCSMPRGGVLGNEPEMFIADTDEKKKQAVEFRLNNTLGTSRTLSEFFVHISKPYRLTVFQLFSQIYDFGSEYEDILKYAWISTEFPHQAKVNDLTRMFRKADGAKLMDESERERLAGLPEEFTVYRGWSETLVKSGMTKRNGLSWTLDRKIAVWFATRWKHPDARLATATIQKKNVYMYCGERSEAEIVLNPRYLRNLKVASDMHMQQATAVGTRIEV